MFGGGGKGEGKEETKKKAQENAEKETEDGEWGSICFDDEEIEIILVDGPMEEGGGENGEWVFEDGPTDTKETDRKETDSGSSRPLSGSRTVSPSLQHRPLTPRPSSPLPPSPPSPSDTSPRTTTSKSPVPLPYSPSVGEVRTRKKGRKKRVDSMVVRAGNIKGGDDPKK